MSTIKLERNGKVIERSQADYNANKERYDFRGFKLVTNTPAKQKKVEEVAEPEPKKSKPKKKAK
tara:strand:+ start:1179 stop:1370 length:192 start_codon:yes stop_codon:yes gene_type:complete